MPATEMGLTELEKEFVADIRRSLERYPDATHVLIYSNHDLSSRDVGQRQALLCGPSNTITSLDKARENSGRSPFNWRFYLDGWIPADLFAE